MPRKNTTQFKLQEAVSDILDAAGMTDTNENDDQYHVVCSNVEAMLENIKLELKDL